jgi:hypothetical protein
VQRSLADERTLFPVRGSSAVKLLLTSRFSAATTHDQKEVIMKTQTTHCHAELPASFMRLISSRRTNSAGEISHSATSDRQMSTFTIGKIGASIVLVLAFACSGQNVFATHTAQGSIDNEIFALHQTAIGKWDPEKEAASIVAENLLELIDAWKNGAFTVGETDINGSNPFVFPGGSSTLTANFTFQWIDSMTGLPTTGPAIATVDYYLWTGIGDSVDPLSSSWTFLGSSSNAASNFQFAYSFSSSENMFYGVPLDSAGNQIVITGAGGYNDAQDTVSDIVSPEPASLLLLGSGVLGFGGLLRKRLLTRT